MVGLLLIGGFFRSLQFTSINTIAYADIEPRRISRATSLVSVAQQLCLIGGVAVGALAVELTMRIKGRDARGQRFSASLSLYSEQFRPPR